MNLKQYRDLLHPIAVRDALRVEEKDKQYGASWKRRGGVGAFMMLARKWDRIEEFVGRVHNYDVFQAIEADSREEALIDDIRDLRRYLLLVEAEMTARGLVTLDGPGPQNQIVITGVEFTPNEIALGGQEVPQIRPEASLTIADEREGDLILLGYQRLSLAAAESAKQQGFAVVGAEETPKHRCTLTDREVKPGEYSPVCRLPAGHEGPCDPGVSYALKRCRGRVLTERCVKPQGHEGACEALFHVDVDGTSSHVGSDDPHDIDTSAHQ